MKLFILSDIHGSYDSCRKALDLFKDFKADRLVLLGDVLYHGPRNPLPESYAPDKVYGLLNKYARKITAVRGNCDAEVDQMFLDFNISDDYAFIAMKDRKVYMSHGHIYDNKKLPPDFSDGDLFLFGHIHKPIADKVKKHYVGNPGSCTFPKKPYPQSYGIVDDEGFTVYDFEGNAIKSLVF